MKESTAARQRQKVDQDGPALQSVDGRRHVVEVVRAGAGRCLSCRVAQCTGMLLCMRPADFICAPKGSAVAVIRAAAGLYVRPADVIYAPKGSAVALIRAAAGQATITLGAPAARRVRDLNQLDVCRLAANMEGQLAILVHTQLTVCRCTCCSQGGEGHQLDVGIFHHLSAWNAATLCQDADTQTCLHMFSRHWFSHLDSNVAQQTRWAPGERGSRHGSASLDSCQSPRAPPPRPPFLQWGMAYCRAC